MAMAGFGSNLVSISSKDPFPQPILSPSTLTMHTTTLLQSSQPLNHTQSSLAAALGPPLIQSDFEPLRKKDGTLSKIRSHRGNVPVLPQTKLCPHCPAKFTRTTHLNRHLRNRKVSSDIPDQLTLIHKTDTNERFHRCDVRSGTP